MRKQSLRLFVVIVAVVFFEVSAAAGQDSTVPKDESLRKGEIRATLAPDLFKDARVKKAYQVAKDIPWVLDSIHCYCSCDVAIGHKSLLSCYVDDHAAM